MGITNTPPSATLCGVLSKSSGPITIMMKMIIVALCVAAAVAMPIQDEESLEVSVEQTQEFGIIKKAWNHVFKKDVSEADVSCKMENCGGCETKYRTGRRLLEADDEELFAEQKWGIFSRRRRAPPKIAYSDCTKRDACLVKNAGCKAKIDQLKVAHEALKKELAEAKAELKEHATNAAAKAKAAAAEAEDAAVAKKAYEDQQAMISNLAKALSDEKHGETQDAEAEAKVVAREVKEDGEAKDDEKKATALMAKATKEFHQAGGALADAKKDVAQETAAARAHQKSEAARFAARVAAAKKRLADAQGALGGLHAAHMKEAGEAASAKSQAAAAEAIRKLKEKNVANHQKAVDESAKKIGEQ